MNMKELSTGQTVKYLFKSGGKDTILDAQVVGVNDSEITIEFRHPGAGYRHRRSFRTPRERARLSPDGVFPQMPEASTSARGPGRPKVGRGTAHVDVTLSLDVIEFLREQKERDPLFNKSRYIDEAVRQSMQTHS